MTANTIRFYLHNWDKLTEDIIELKEAIQIAELYSGDIDISPDDAETDSERRIITDMNGIGGIFKTFASDRSDGSQKNPQIESQPENIAIGRADKIAEYKKELYTKNTIYRAISCVLRYMPDNSLDWEIIHRRYFIKNKAGRCFTWQRIASDLNYCEETLKKRDNYIISEMLNNYNLRKVHRIVPLINDTRFR